MNTEQPEANTTPTAQVTVAARQTNTTRIGRYSYTTTFSQKCLIFLPFLIYVTAKTLAEGADTLNPDWYGKTRSDAQSLTWMRLFHQSDGGGESDDAARDLRSPPPGSSPTSPADNIERLVLLHPGPFVTVRVFSRRHQVREIGNLFGLTTRVLRS